MKLTDPQKSKEAVQDLEARFLEGERLTLDEIINEFFNLKNSGDYYNCKGLVKSWISTLKRRIAVDHELWFGSVDDSGHFGIALTEGEYRYAMIRYFNFIKGNVKRAVQLRGEAQGKGYLEGSKNIILSLPEPPKELNQKRG